MTAVTLWRSPALRYGDTRRRALWGCFAGFAAACWLKTAVVGDAMTHVPVTELPILLEESFGTAAIVSIISYVAASYGRTDQAAPPQHVVISRYIARIAPRVGLAVVIAITVIFFTVVDRRETRAEFGVAHVGEWGATTFLTVFYMFLGTSCSVTGYQWSSAARRAETRLLRTGLILMATAMGIGLTYVVIRTIYLWAAVAVPASRSLSPVVAHLGSLMIVVLFAAFAAGSSIPSATAAAARWTSLRTLGRLYPLWRDLVEAFPDVAFEGALPGCRVVRRSRAGLLSELTDWSLPLDVRLGFRVHNIADAAEQLRDYAPPGLFYAAEDAVEEAGEGSPNLAAAAEALYIKAALRAAALGRRTAVPSEPLPSKPLARTDAEARWWCQVQRAYAAVTSAQAEELLLAVGSGYEHA
ncbi:MAB_1171c family putative transporter [Streptomyces sp. NPDC057654]|uniref:MAB_1171c family putative transporter n=1 Tax=Streptomyces sp. NPDC057654 TaxID=3346196 RepID=UPI00368D8F65